MVNYLSIDFESWAYPELPEFKNLSSEERKAIDDGYVKDSAEKILALLKKHKTRMTFFVLGQLYDWYPETIEKIAQEGHEIAYHTHTHDILYSKEILINTLERSRKFLKKFKPKGFRAPNIIIKKDYLQILSDYGFSYDSSVYGDYFSKYRAYDMVELPVSKFFRLPVGSGYFIAALGKKISLCYRQINKNKNPVIAFVHNWQIIKPKNSFFPNKSYLLKHPYYWPYTLEIYDTFEYLLQNFTFLPLIKLINRKE